jgi:uncharacterized membrane protein YfcA
MRRFAQILPWITALAAFFSAGFWIASATVTLPAVTTYWGTTPPTDPYQQALAHSATYNFWAAAFAALAAIAQGLSIALKRR